MAHLLISAAHKSSGKTTISVGLCAALHRRGLAVQPFKKGPDYIDPLWLSAATDRQCHNLDFHTMNYDEIRKTFRHYAYGSDIAVIEGNKGLFDGLDLEGRNSNAALSKLLKAPVVLVIDARGMTRGIAPLILGYQAFDPKVKIAGVILNKLGGKRHEGKLRAVIEHYTDVPVIGAVHQNDILHIDERHLGLVPSNEANISAQHLDDVAHIMENEIDIDRVIRIAETAPKQVRQLEFPPASKVYKKVKIAVVRDEAFGFYYPGDLEALESAGAELVYISALHTPHLPHVDGIFIGGGFPETHGQQLQANASLRNEIQQAVEYGLPVYAECGGLMYLSRELTWHDQTYQMCGAIPADTVMHKTPQGRGYVRLRETGSSPWASTNNDQTPREFCAHEFHYSGLENISPEIEFAYDVIRGHGITGKHDGLVYKNTLASYAHMRNVSHNQWAPRFVQFVSEYKDKTVHKNIRATA